jgi:hypothetical protein
MTLLSLSKNKIHRRRKIGFIVAEKIDLRIRFFAIEWITHFDLFPTFQIDLGKYFEGDAVKRDMD